MRTHYIVFEQVGYCSLDAHDKQNNLLPTPMLIGELLFLMLFSLYTQRLTQH